eukprot:Hpha_TRINITY_DN15029_c5_g10::TRINITY_DN15029_c5_g10_i1::g.125583::m.125583
MGEVQLFVRNADALLPVTLHLAATVGDLIKAAQEVAQLDGPPGLRYHGEELNDPAMALADVGLSNQSTVELVTGLSFTVHRYVDQPRYMVPDWDALETESKKVTLRPDAALDDLQKGVGDWNGIYVDYYIIKPGKEPSSVRRNRWSKATLLVPP